MPGKAELGAGRTGAAQRLRERVGAAGRRRGAPPQVLYGLSFDGVAISGIVSEFLTLSEIFHQRGWQVHFDLGYDVKSDKGRFFAPYDGEAQLLPAWVRLARIAGLEKVADYGPALVDEALERLVRDPRGCAHGGFERRVERVVRGLAERIVAAWRRLGVSFVVVENGTLPENLLFTRALVIAVERYGRERRLGPYVLWRDHDVMWFCEPRKYGPGPYDRVPRPRPSPHVRYAALTDRASQALSRWGGGVEIEVIPNCFHFAEARVTPANAGLRGELGIPPEALLLARCTRIIPQKRIDREIHLLAELQRIARRLGDARPIYLCVTGAIAEHPVEHRHLLALARDMGVERQVVFADGLAAAEASRQEKAAPRRRYTVRDLLAHCDLSSFLTSYDYEGFGNPPGEASAALRPFLSTTYELYECVYGAKGFQTLALPITRERDGLCPASYAQDVYDLLRSPERRRREAAHNFELGRRHFSLEALTWKLQTLFPSAMGADEKPALPRRSRNLSGGSLQAIPSRRRYGSSGGPKIAGCSTM